MVVVLKKQGLVPIYGTGTLASIRKNGIAETTSLCGLHLYIVQLKHIIFLKLGRCKP
jgi:hypothetical protein